MSSVVAKRNTTTCTRSAYQTRILKDDATANVFDFTERKLRSMSDHHSDEDVRKLAARMLNDYLAGSIAIAWENGNIPIYCFVKS